MKRLKLSALDLDSLQSVVDIEEHPIADYPWLDVDHIVLREDEQQQIEAIVHCLRKSSTNLFNEATIWGKAIFPLFLLAEQGNIEAWTEVPLSAQYAQFELDGIADGVLGRGIAGRITAPYLVMVEAKRGIDGENPIFGFMGKSYAVLGKIGGGIEAILRSWAKLIARRYLVAIPSDRRGSLSGLRWPGLRILLRCRAKLIARCSGWNILKNTLRRPRRRGLSESLKAWCRGTWQMPFRAGCTNAGRWRVIPKIAGNA
ncbi:MAG: hypothetical protein HC857_04505 [Synechococcales cyanobacterium RU_4_20]|nr:hypothetical protein [Synechococcales cyanobacterium RU_4_20]